MSNSVKSALLAVLIVSSVSSLAGLPKNATLIEKGVARHDEVYRTYAIKCEDSTVKAYVTSWGAERKWCEGRDGSLKNCSIKKKKVARSVCDSATPVSSL